MLMPSLLLKTYFVFVKNERDCKSVHRWCFGESPQSGVGRAWGREWNDEASNALAAESTSNLAVKTFFLRSVCVKLTYRLLCKRTLPLFCI